MKNAILKFLISLLGSVLTPIISLGAGIAIAKLAALNPQLAGMADQTAITGFIVTSLVSLANYYTNAANGDGVKSIQAMVGAKADGVAGPQTYIEVRKATLP